MAFEQIIKGKSRRLNAGEIDDRPYRFSSSSPIPQRLIGEPKITGRVRHSVDRGIEDVRFSHFEGVPDVTPAPFWNCTGIERQVLEDATLCARR